MSHNKRKRTSSSNAIHENSESITEELTEINQTLENEETTQKQTWRIGKRLKTLIENENISLQQSLDAYFLWGIALTRLASQNEDTTLAEAAIDKFEQMEIISKAISMEKKVKDEDIENTIDEAIGCVGYSLWATALLEVAMEKQEIELLKKAIDKFQKAVDVDGGLTFETRFQLAKALKQVGDVLNTIKGQEEKAKEHYIKALAVCEEMETIYKKIMLSKNSQEEEVKESDDSEDSDYVTIEDYAELNLLVAVIHSLLDQSPDTFTSTYALFCRAQELHTENTKIVEEMTAFVCKSAKNEAFTSVCSIPWKDIQLHLYKSHEEALLRLQFHWRRKCKSIFAHISLPTISEEKEDEMEDETIDENIPSLLESLGTFYVVLLQGPMKWCTELKDHLKPKTIFQDAVLLLYAAHHYHDQLGCYGLACLWAITDFLDEERCQHWLDTCETYGVLEESLDLTDFSNFALKQWFQTITKPASDLENE